MNCRHLSVPLVIFMAITVSASTPTNLLGDADGTSPADWGTCVRIPPDTGEFNVRDGTMTIVRKRPRGDFKIYRVFKGLKAGAEYILNFRIKVDAKTPARVGILDSENDHGWSWNTEPVVYEPTGEWRQATIRFKGRPGKPKGCLQLYPPKDVGGRVSFGVLSIWSVQQLHGNDGSEDVYPCHRLKQAPQIDGQLGEDAWRLLPEVCGFALLTGGKNVGDGLQLKLDRPQGADVIPEFVTDALSFFQAGYTDSALYVAVRCYQPRARRLPASETDNAQLWREESRSTWQPVRTSQRLSSS